MEDIILQYTWPRIDAEVSKHRNHLLKAPFCVHPKTGRVCVPVDPTRIDEFDPGTVPTAGQLLKEIDEAMVINHEDGAEGTQHLPGELSLSCCCLLRKDFSSHECEGVRIVYSTPRALCLRSLPLMEAPVIGMPFDIFSDLMYDY